MVIYKATALTSGLFSPIFIALEKIAPVAQLDRASVYETEGYRFDSRQVHFPYPIVALALTTHPTLNYQECETPAN